MREKETGKGCMGDGGWWVEEWWKMGRECVGVRVWWLEGWGKGGGGDG